MEGMMAMNNVEWTPENIKKAEKACKEAQQMVIIKTIDVSDPGDSTLWGWYWAKPGKEGRKPVNDKGGNTGSGRRGWGAERCAGAAPDCGVVGGSPS